ncbi:hypothetical protein [Gaoshiqia sp. Z1-71]|uniref:hypothetical protein n=1 Tax=Gaoshiqia hydrogeniformans TaxID=3290090 RepID=UPI003BF81779
MKSQIYILLIFMNIAAFGQETTNDLQKIIRANVLSPGLEMEMPITNKSAISANVGIGINGSYKNLSYANSGLTYFLSPFLDLSYKRYYSRDAMLSNGENIPPNSGFFWGVRLLTNFKEIETENIIRKDDIDFAFGPTWGIQRAYGSLHLLFDAGPVYYFDTIGNCGFFPIALQLNIGFDVKRW